MRRTKAVPAAVALAAFLTAFASMTVAGVAQATQTGYPPGPCTATVSSQALGTFQVGQSFTATLSPVCAWTAGTPVTITVNGQVVGTKVAALNGTVPITVNIVSSTVLEIDDPVRVPAVCGTNTITATGASTVANGTVTNTATFTVICPAAATTSPRVAFTGANVVRLAAGALVLVLLGGLIVTSSRNRRRTSAGV